MAWLGTRLRGRHFSRTERATKADLPPEGETATATGARPLVLLVPEARKTAAFRLHTFADAEEAAAFIQRWFWPGTSSGVIAFWALHQPPLPAAGEGQPEAIALVREEEGSDVVYFSSFRDMGSARSLVRAKAKRGLDLGLTLVYWAAPVTIDYEEPWAVLLTPATRPAAHCPPDAELAPSLQEDRAGRQAHVAAEPPEPAFEPPEATAEALDGGEDTAEVSAEGYAEPEPWTVALDDVEETAAISANGNGLAPWTEVSDDAEETAEVGANGNGLSPWTEVSDDVEQTAEVSAEAGAPDAWGGEEVAEEDEDEPVAIDRLVSELDKVLRVSRWDNHDGPFEGFGSPPGKF